MNVNLFNNIPTGDGYFLMKMNRIAGLHLVLITTDFDGSRFIHLDNPKSKPIAINESHGSVFKEALFSEKIEV